MSTIDFAAFRRAEYDELRRLLANGLQVLQDRYRGMQEAKSEEEAAAHKAGYETAWTVVSACLHELDEDDFGVDELEKLADLSAIRSDEGILVLPIPRPAVVDGKPRIRWSYAISSEREIDNMRERTYSAALYPEP